MQKEMNWKSSMWSGRLSRAKKLNKGKPLKNSYSIEKIYPTFFRADYLVTGPFDPFGTGFFKEQPDQRVLPGGIAVGTPEHRAVADGERRHPHGPSSTAEPVPPARPAITGLAQAFASMKTRPKPSVMRVTRAQVCHTGMQNIKMTCLRLLQEISMNSLAPAWLSGLTRTGHWVTITAWRGWGWNSCRTRG